MAKFEDHVEKCQDINGKHDRNICEQVNRQIDQFAHYPDMRHLHVHRMFLHHEEGAQYFRRKYGEVGYACAITHIKIDCGNNVPQMIHYHNGICDNYGYAGLGDYEPKDH